MLSDPLQTKTRILLFKGRTSSLYQLITYRMKHFIHLWIYHFSLFLDSILWKHPRQKLEYSEKEVSTCDVINRKLQGSSFSSDRRTDDIVGIRLQWTRILFTCTDILLICIFNDYSSNKSIFSSILLVFIVLITWCWYYLETFICNLNRPGQHCSACDSKPGYNPAVWCV